MLKRLEPVVPVSEAVERFAEAQGVVAELPEVVAMTQRLFPGQTLSVELEDDPEIANDRHIVIIVRPDHLSVDEALDRRWEWHRGLFESCPAPRVCVFRLGLELS